MRRNTTKGRWRLANDDASAAGVIASARPRREDRRAVRAWQSDMEMARTLATGSATCRSKLAYRSGLARRSHPLRRPGCDQEGERLVATGVHPIFRKADHQAVCAA